MGRIVDVELPSCVVGAIWRRAGTDEDDDVRVSTQLEVISSSDGLSEVFGITDSEYSADRDRGDVRILDDEANGAVAVHVGDRIGEWRVVECQLSSLPSGHGIERWMVEPRRLSAFKDQSFTRRERDDPVAS